MCHLKYWIQDLFSILLKRNLFILMIYLTLIHLTDPSKLQF
jgi:hypothetical protein